MVGSEDESSFVVMVVKIINYLNKSSNSVVNYLNVFLVFPEKLFVM